MRKSGFLSVSMLAGFVTACSNASSPTQSSKFVSLSASLFSYEISSRWTLLDSLDSEDQYQNNGSDVHIVKNEIVGIFDGRGDETKLESLLLPVGGHVKEHWSVNTAQPIRSGSKENGSATVVYPEPMLKYLPYYSIELRGDESDDLSDLDQVAAQAGVTGHYKFPNKRVASFMRKLWKLNAGHADAPLFVQNSVMDEISAATPEGYLFPNFTGTQYSPTSSSFWWCNRYNAGSNVGANINNTSTGEKASDYSYAANVKVGVIDTEFRYDNETYMPAAIIPRIEVVWNDTVGGGSSSTFNGYNAQISPHVWHGREVSSLVFAPESDGCGTLGNAPGALPYLYKGYGNDASWARCYYQAIAHGCRVVNMSFGVKNNSVNPFPLLDQAIQYGAQQNPSVIAVAAAGNTGDGWFWPAAHNNVVTVGATNSAGNKALFSTGDYSNSWNVDIWAPGKDVAVGAWPSSARYPGYSSIAPSSTQFRLNEGTSFAAPIVTGVVACMIDRGYVSNCSTAISRLQSRGHTVNNVSPGKSLNVLNSVKP